MFRQTCFFSFVNSSRSRRGRAWGQKRIAPRFYPWKQKALETNNLSFQEIFCPLWSLFSCQGRWKYHHQSYHTVITYEKLDERRKLIISGCSHHPTWSIVSSQQRSFLPEEKPAAEVESRKEMAAETLGCRSAALMWGNNTVTQAPLRERLCKSSAGWITTLNQQLRLTWLISVLNL